ncbi:hypothetical protein QDT91_28390 (plasmid) [Mycolicibacterium aubagnense]|uniref:hypothetical protein n=1 Tax=Mycolicibacterium aubagnense TaxID=319707 RepID=UPI00244DA38C|nr:hypothetical protein [Mycolicibacterium aubagnense]WGI35929.1 hypothetical protein QDT91_28390 [Mycolicibacterium aubagnense]
MTAQLPYYEHAHDITVRALDQACRTIENLAAAIAGDARACRHRINRKANDRRQAWAREDVARGHDFATFDDLAAHGNQLREAERRRGIDWGDSRWDQIPLHSPGMRLHAAARKLAYDRLEHQDPTRLARTRMVVAEVKWLAHIIDPGVVGILAAAAWAHDIADTPRTANGPGLPALDSARLARKAGLPASVVDLIAFHGGTRFDASTQGAARRLRTYSPPPQTWLAILNAAYLSTGPQGQVLAPKHQAQPIINRHKDNPRTRAAATHELDDDVNTLLATAWYICPDGFEPDAYDTNTTRGIKGAALRAGWRIEDEWGGRCTLISGQTTLTLRFIPPSLPGHAARPAIDNVRLWRDGESLDLPRCLQSEFFDTDLTALTALVKLLRQHSAGATEAWHAA